MAAPNSARMQNVPGVLVKDPSSFTAGTPWGGTVLGSAEGIVVIPNVGNVPIQASELGTTVEVLYTGESWGIACALREYDDDITSRIFRRTTVGTVTGLNVVEHSPAETRAGLLMSTVSIALAFIADDPLTNPSIYFPRCIVLLEESARLALNLVDMMVFPVVFQAIPHASKPQVSMGLLEDLTT